MPIHDLGNHLVLEFMDTPVDLEDCDYLDTHLREMLSHTSVTIESHLKKKYDT